MTQFASIMVPPVLFMLIPLWIPLAAVAGGAVMDRLRPVPMTPASAAVAAAKERSARLHEVTATSTRGAHRRGATPEPVAA
jgi:hypothetical protein